LTKRKTRHLVGAARDEALVRHFFIAGIRPEQRQKQRKPLFDKGLAGEIADRLAGKTLFRDRERRRERQIGILHLLRVSVMLQMVRAVAG
jgi:hypothetical protein